MQSALSKVENRQRLWEEADKAVQEAQKQLNVLMDAAKQAKEALDAAQAEFEEAQSQLRVLTQAGKDVDMRACPNGAGLQALLREALEGLSPEHELANKITAALVAEGKGVNETTPAPAAQPPVSLFRPVGSTRRSASAGPYSRGRSTLRSRTPDRREKQEPGRRNVC